jgi:hypothetical protein
MPTTPQIPRDHEALGADERRDLRQALDEQRWARLRQAGAIGPDGRLRGGELLH